MKMAKSFLIKFKELLKKIGRSIHNFLIPDLKDTFPELYGNLPEEGKIKITLKEAPAFKEVWNTYIMPLNGKVVHLLEGRTNTITYVGDDGLRRISINGKESRIIPIGVFEYTYQRLTESPDGIIWREKEILAHAKSKYHSLSSAIVVAVFAQAVPFISRFNGSQGLKLNLK